MPVWPAVVIFPADVKLVNELFLLCFPRVSLILHLRNTDTNNDLDWSMGMISFSKSFQIYSIFCSLNIKARKYVQVTFFAIFPAPRLFCAHKKKFAGKSNYDPNDIRSPFVTQKYLGSVLHVFPVGLRCSLLRCWFGIGVLGISRVAVVG